MNTVTQSHPTDHRDVVIHDLAMDVADLEAQVADLRADRDAYRALAQTALAQLATLTQTVRVQKRRIADLCDDRRPAHVEGSTRIALVERRAS